MITKRYITSDDGLMAMASECLRLENISYKIVGELTIGFHKKPCRRARQILDTNHFVQVVEE